VSAFGFTSSGYPGPPERHLTKDPLALTDFARVPGTTPD
jgi:hypothetical protein